MEFHNCLHREADVSTYGWKWGYNQTKFFRIDAFAEFSYLWSSAPALLAAGAPLLILSCHQGHVINIKLSARTHFITNTTFLVAFCIEFECLKSALVVYTGGPHIHYVITYNKTIVNVCSCFFFWLAAVILHTIYARSTYSRIPTKFPSETIRKL